MGLMLLIQTLLICLIRRLINKSYWFSYILFLIFLGGLLILFIYVSSLASNEIFNFSSTIFFFRIFITFSINFILFFFDNNLIINYFNNYETNILNYFREFFPENTLIINKLYNYPINLITIILIIYLFLTLIAIVKITNIFEGPLRPKTN